MKGFSLSTINWCRLISLIIGEGSRLAIFATLYGLCLCWDSHRGGKWQHDFLHTIFKVLGLSQILRKPVPYHITYSRENWAGSKGAQAFLTFKPAIGILVRHPCGNPNATGGGAGRPLSAPVFTQIGESHPS